MSSTFIFSPPPLPTYFISTFSFLGVWLASSESLLRQAIFLTAASATKPGDPWLRVYSNKSGEPKLKAVGPSVMPPATFRKAPGANPRSFAAATPAPRPLLQRWCPSRLWLRLAKATGLGEPRASDALGQAEQGMPAHRPSPRQSQGPVLPSPHRTSMGCRAPLHCSLQYPPHRPAPLASIPTDLCIVHFNTHRTAPHPARFNTHHATPHTARFNTHRTTPLTSIPTAPCTARFSIHRTTPLASIPTALCRLLQYPLPRTVHRSLQYPPPRSLQYPLPRTPLASIPTAPLRSLQYPLPCATLTSIPTAPHHAPLASIPTAPHRSLQYLPHHPACFNTHCPVHCLL